MSLTIENTGLNESQRTMGVVITEAVNFKLEVQKDIVLSITSSTKSESIWSGMLINIFYNTPMEVSNIVNVDNKTKKLGSKESALLVDPGTGRKCDESLAC